VKQPHYGYTGYGYRSHYNKPHCNRYGY
jgi:hypothetical protein